VTAATPAPSRLPPPRTAAAPWLVVAGAKGGVGKTVLATNLALLLCRAGYRTLLVDFDPGCGNVAVHFRLSARRDLEDLAAGACSWRDAIVDGPAGLQLLLGRSGSTLLSGGNPELLACAIDRVGAAGAEFDVVLCDTGAGIGAVSLAVAERAQLVLSVATADPAALTDAYALAKVLHRRGHALPRLVVNRVKSREEALRAAAKLAAVVRKFLAVESHSCGWISDDPRIERSVVDQRPLALFGGGTSLADIEGVCAQALAGLPALGRRRARPPIAQMQLRPASR
jgi:flagellar biosynthesis protein FlhG